MSTAKSSASDQPPERVDGAPVEVFNRQRRHVIDRQAAASLSRAVLDRVGRCEATLAITFINDRRMRELNRDFRDIDAPTDVLSFAYQDNANVDEPQTDPRHLGDLVISAETAARYATTLNLEFAREIEYLVIHGTLHLAGYDHETDNGEMKRLERKLRRELLDHPSQ